MNPALPLDDAGPYVAAAFLVFLALVLIYVAIQLLAGGNAGGASTGTGNPLNDILGMGRQ